MLPVIVLAGGLFVILAMAVLAFSGPSAATVGRLLPQPRWSNRITR